jgi:hypothetical protein
MHAEIKNNVIFFLIRQSLITLYIVILQSDKRAMDIQDNVCLTPPDNRDDLVRGIAAMAVSGRCRMCLRENGGNFQHLL